MTIFTKSLISETSMARNTLPNGVPTGSTQSTGKPIYQWPLSSDHSQTDLTYFERIGRELMTLLQDSTVRSLSTSSCL